HSHIAGSRSWQVPSKQDAEKLQALLKSAGSQAAPSARTCGQVLVVTVWQDPRSQRMSVPSQASPALANRTFPHFDVAGSQVRPVAHLKSCRLQVSPSAILAAQTLFAHRSPRLHSAPVGQEPPVSCFGAHVLAGGSQYRSLAHSTPTGRGSPAFAAPIATF